MIRIASPGPGERLPPHHPLGHAELLADAAHLVLEEEPERLDELHRHVLGQPADVVVRLDLGGDAVGPARLDHIRVERPLDEELDVAELGRLLLEDADELLADPVALLLRLGDALEPREEALLRLDVHERDLEVAAERLRHLLGLVRAHEAVVDEDAGELIADRLVDEQGGDGGVDAAGERAEDALRADLGADPLHLLLDHGGRRPGRRRIGDPVEEVLQHVLPVRRVDDFRVELDAVEPPGRILERRDGRRGGASRDRRAERRRGDRVAMAHPDGLLRRQPVEERARAVVELGLAELRGPRSRDLAAELERHQLGAVADAERGDPELEELLVDPRRPLRVDRRGAAGEDHRDGVAPADLRRAQRVRDELGVDPGIADAARDQLRVLAAEVEHEHRTLLGRGFRGRKRMDGAHQVPITGAGSSASPS